MREIFDWDGSTKHVAVLIDPDKISSADTYFKKTQELDVDGLKVPLDLRSYSEAEWEFMLCKLHGKYMSTSREDFEALKKIVERL